MWTWNQKTQVKMPSLQACLTPQVVARAWADVRNDPARWSVTQTRPNGAHQLADALQVVEELRLGNYRAQAMHHFTLYKANGKQRNLSALCVRDKFAQRLIAIGLEPVLEQLFHHDSFAYRPKRNVQQAVQRCRERLKMGLHWLVDADIEAFFDSIPHKPLLQAFRSFASDAKLNELIAQWLAIGTYTRGYFEQARGIPQGSVISPLLCNLYLHPFDQALSNAALPFVRYADDFLVFTPDRKTAERAQLFVAKELEKLSLRLSAEKTRLVNTAEQVVSFLGENLKIELAAKR